MPEKPLINDIDNSSQRTIRSNVNRELSYFSTSQNAFLKDAFAKCDNLNGKITSLQKSIKKLRKNIILTKHKKSKSSKGLMKIKKSEKLAKAKPHKSHGNKGQHEYIRKRIKDLQHDKDTRQSEKFKLIMQE